METVNLTCKGADSDGFESAIAQLGYSIVDVHWDDESDTMYYIVEKKWLKF